MAVSKELLARYKELKAQGVNITISELKAQMEAEGVNNNDLLATETPKPTGFSALSTCEPKHEPAQIYSEPTHQQPQQESSWSTSYYTQPEEPKVETPIESYSSSFETAGSSMMQSNSIESYSYNSSYVHPEPQHTYQEPQQSYYQAEPYPTYEQPQVHTQPYSGNVASNNSVDTTSYNSNFNADFSWQQSNNQQMNQPTEAPKTKYTGNLPPQPASSFFGPAVVDNNVQTSNPIQNGKYCLIGYPLGHSLSNHIHNETTT